MPERNVARLLDLLGVAYERQRVFSGIGVVDFFIPEDRLVIEVDGDYWHSLPKAKRRDPIRDLELEMNGLTVLRIPEHEVVEKRQQWSQVRVRN